MTDVKLIMKRRPKKNNYHKWHSHKNLKKKLKSEKDCQKKLIDQGEVLYQKKIRPIIY